MSKFYKTLVLVVGLLFFTGCGEKVLKCSRESSSYNDEMVMTQVAEISFKDDKMTKVSIKMDVNFSENVIQFRDNILDSSLEEFKSLEDIKGFSYNSKNTDNGFSINIKADINKMNDSEKERFIYINTSNGYDAEKLEMEEDEYICE